MDRIVKLFIVRGTFGTKALATNNDSAKHRVDSLIDILIVLVDVFGNGMSILSSEIRRRENIGLFTVVPNPSFLLRFNLFAGLCGIVFGYETLCSFKKTYFMLSYFLY